MAVIILENQSEVLGAVKTLNVLEYSSENFNNIPLSKKGYGYLAGQSPTEHLKMPDGTPASFCKLELYNNGIKIDETYSDSNGSWKFENLNHNLVYDIIAKHPILEGIVSTKRQPAVMPVDASLIAVFETGAAATYKYHVTGGLGVDTYSASDLTASPNVTSIVFKNNILTVDITKTETEENYQIQVESLGVIEPLVIDITTPYI